MRPGMPAIDDSLDRLKNWVVEDNNVITLKPRPGESGWKRCSDYLKGNKLHVVLNGEPIIDLDLSQGAMRDRPATGYISFQDEAKRIWYRNVRIKPLK